MAMRSETSHIHEALSQTANSVVTDPTKRLYYSACLHLMVLTVQNDEAQPSTTWACS
jgi:hypothetical protein